MAQHLSAAHRMGVRLPRPLGTFARVALVRGRHTGLRANDLILASYPKSGSTWVRFVLASALSGLDVDFDLVADLSPPLGRHRKARPILPGGGRLVKSHELPSFVGRRGGHPRVLCVVRDGRDVGVSYWHALHRKGRMNDDLDTFFDKFSDGTFAQFGSWQEHARQWLAYAKTRDSGVMFIRYEDLLADSLPTMMAVNETLDLGLGEQQLSAALRDNTSSGMRAKESGSRVLAARSATAEPFVRSARSGGWQEDLAPAAVARFESVAGQQLQELGYALSSDH